MRIEEGTGVEEEIYTAYAAIGVYIRLQTLVSAG